MGEWGYNGDIPCGYHAKYILNGIFYYCSTLIHHKWDVPILSYHTYRLYLTNGDIQWGYNGIYIYIIYTYY